MKQQSKDIKLSAIIQSISTNLKRSGLLTVVSLFFLFSCNDLHDLDEVRSGDDTASIEMQDNRPGNGGGPPGGGGDDGDDDGDNGDDGDDDGTVEGDVGGIVYGNPGTITLELRWGNNFQNSEVIEVTGDGPYAFPVNIRNNTLFRVFGKDAPDGWACRAKQTDTRISNSSSDDTHVYCGTSSSPDGIRVATWNLEWYDDDNDPDKKQAIADLINEWNFDVMNLTEVLDDVAVNDLIQNYLGNANDWDFRITDAGCSLKQVTLWRKSAVTFESGYELNASTSGGIIDEDGDIWRNCIGRRPYVANFSVNNSDVEFTTTTVHFKAGSKSSDCEVRRDQVDTLVGWINWAEKNQRNFAVIGDFNDELPGTGICSSINTLESMESRTDFTFVTAQPDYHYSYMMGNGLVTFDTRSFQSTIDHLWVTNSLFDRLLQDVDIFGNYANTAQANMLFWPWGEPDHNPPYMVIGR